MQKIVQVAALSLLAITLAAGCRSAHSGAKAAKEDPAPKKLADAGKYTISVLTDLGATEGLSASDLKQRQQVRDGMGPDMVKILTQRGGFKAREISARDQFKAGPDEYLLTIKIVKYNPGSKAARIVVGFGAGSCSLDLHYELFGAEKDPVLSKDDGVGSGLEWTRCVRKLNKNILSAINGTLASQKQPAK